MAVSGVATGPKVGSQVWQLRAGIFDASGPDELDQLDQLFAGFSGVARRFDDLQFSTSGGTLELRRRIPGVTCVRIELLKTEYLHLATVLVEAADGADPSAEATVTTSSTLPAYKETEGRRLLFESASTEVAVHTSKQHRPWLQLGFEAVRADLSVTCRRAGAWWGTGRRSRRRG